MEISEKTRWPRKLKDAAIFLLVFGAVFLLWYGFWKWVDANVTSVDAQHPTAEVQGQFGDKFGAVNALFSGFAFAGIILTLLIQRRDIAAQHAVTSKQRFDATFFQLLNLHVDITSKLSSLESSGRDALDVINQELKNSDDDFFAFCALQKLDKEKIRRMRDAITRQNNYLANNFASYEELEKSDLQNLINATQNGTTAIDNFLDEDCSMHEKKVKEAYTKACVKYIDDFSHYFRNLYHILRFIADSTLISESEKKTYSKFVRSQLSEVELVALFYNSITEIELPGRKEMELGFPKMGALLQKFDLLQNMSPRSVIHPIHQTIFDKKYAEKK